MPFSFGQVILAALENEQKMKQQEAALASQERYQQGQLQLGEERNAIDREQYQSTERWRNKEFATQETRYQNELAERRRANPDIVGEDIPAYYRRMGVPTEHVPAVAGTDTVPYERLQKDVATLLQNLVAKGQLEEGKARLSYQKMIFDKMKYDEIRAREADVTAEKMRGITGLPDLPEERVSQGLIGKTMGQAAEFIDKGLGGLLHLGMSNVFGIGTTSYQQAFKNIMSDTNYPTISEAFRQTFTDTEAKGYNASQWKDYGARAIAYTNSLLPMKGKRLNEMSYAQVREAAQALGEYNYRIKTGVTSGERSAEVLSLMKSLNSWADSFNPYQREEIKQLLRREAQQGIDESKAANQSYYRANPAETPIR